MYYGLHVPLCAQGEAHGGHVFDYPKAHIDGHVKVFYKGVANFLIFQNIKIERSHVVNIVLVMNNEYG